MDEIETLREQAARYLSMLESIDDARARAAVVEFAARCASQAAALEGAQEGQDPKEAAFPAQAPQEGAPSSG